MLTRRIILPALVAFVGVAASILASYAVFNQLQQKAIKEFAFAADQVTLQVRERLESCHLILRGGAALLEERSQISRQDWRHFYNRLDVERTLPGIQGIGFAPYLLPAGLAAHEAAARAEGFADYRVWPAGQRNAYAPVSYIEPFSGQNLVAFGRDMLAEPVRREAMERARDTGLPSLSGKVTLVGEPEKGAQAGAMMYMAVYRHSALLETVEQRRAALVGWVVSPYRIGDMLAGTLNVWASREGRYVDMHLYDGDTRTSDNLLFDSVVTEAPSKDSPFLQQRQIDFYGRQWRLEFDRIPTAPPVNYQEAWLVLAGGFSITLLLVSLVQTLATNREVAEQIASGLTISLRQREQELLEAQRIGKTGSWRLDLANNTIVWSEALERIFGETHEEVSGLSLMDYEQRFTPDSWKQVVAAFASALETGQSYQQELEVISIKGAHAWLLVRGEVIRDDDGKIVGLQGSAADITERHVLEQYLRQKQAELEDAQRIGHIGSWTIDVLTGDVTWSEEMYRMTGRDPALPAPGIEEQEQLFAGDSFRRINEAVVGMYADGMPYHLELEFQRADGTQGWMDTRGEAVYGEKGDIVALHGTAADITERKLAQLRVEYLSRLYAALSASHAVLLQCDSQPALFARICEIVVDIGDMKMAWVGLVDEATDMIVPVAQYGAGTAYLEGIEISVRADEPHGRGPTGTAVRENRPVWVQDFNATEMTVPWQARAREYGWHGSASLPLCSAGKPVGALTFYAASADFFDAEIRALLQEISDSVSLGIDKLASDAVALAHAATLRESEQRFRILVEQSIAGAYILQDNVIVYANPRVATILGYEDNRLLLERSPLDFIALKDRDRIVARIGMLLAGEIGRSDDLFTALRKDGSTVEIGVGSTIVSYRGRPAVIGLMQDISDRQVAENQIRRYAQQLEHTFIQTVQLATTISEMRDAYTAGHERRVAEIAVAIGQEMGLDSAIIEGLRIGGYLHDVGKITIPAEILAKPTRLTSMEYALIQNHAQAGYDVLKEVDFPWPVAQIALQHHERIDGSGYPQGLKGDDIILEARIMAVADVVESMASHRPYRAGLGIDRALAEIESGAGTAFDPVVAAACLRLFREKGFALPVYS